MTVLWTHRGIGQSEGGSRMRVCAAKAKFHTVGDRCRFSRTESVTQTRKQSTPKGWRVRAEEVEREEESGDKTITVEEFG